MRLLVTFDMKSISDHHGFAFQCAVFATFPNYANKTKEFIFRRRSKSPKSVTYPPEPLIPGAERVTALRVLGVVISSRLTMGDHLDQLLSSCASSIFALRTLKSHGLRPPLLHQVARATTVASLL